jgi:hypothetical protein
MHRAALILAGLLLATPAAAQTIDNVNGSIEIVLGDHTRFEEAFAALQTAVTDEDYEAVAVLVSYPITVRSTPEELPVETPEAFVENYDAIMTEEIVSAIIGQKYETLFVNGEGIMFGNGQVWMSGVCEDDVCENWTVKVITIQSVPSQ